MHLLIQIFSFNFICKLCVIVLNILFLLIERQRAAILSLYLKMLFNLLVQISLRWYKYHSTFYIEGMDLHLLKIVLKQRMKKHFILISERWSLRGDCFGGFLSSLMIRCIMFVEACTFTYLNISGGSH